MCLQSLCCPDDGRKRMMAGKQRVKWDKSTERRRGKRDKVQ
jgi:hypothetical protein